MLRRVLSLFFLPLAMSAPHRNKSNNIDCHPLEVGYCLNVTGYPNDAIEDALRKDHRFDSWFLPTTTTKLPCRSYKRDVANGSLDEAVSLTGNVCPEVTRTLNPLAAKDAEGIWRLIVNTDTYRQSITVGHCRDPNRKCSSGSACLTGSAPRHLLTYDASSDRILNRELFFPRSCYCSLWNNDG